MTPQDKMAFIGDPPLFQPEADEVHISVTFTWDINAGYRLKRAWGEYYSKVLIGGLAINGSRGQFIPGRYLKHGITITSRGCNRKCPWCLVPEKEGKIKLLEVKQGWIIQDNNLLMTPRSHQDKVYRMLQKLNRPAWFNGGIDARLVDDWFVDQVRKIKIGGIFLSADSIDILKYLKEAVEKLGFLGREKLRCYVLIGFNHDETIDEARERLIEVWNIGCLPFAQLYRPADIERVYNSEWRNLARKWMRPAIMRSIMNGERQLEGDRPIAPTM